MSFSLAGQILTGLICAYGCYEIFLSIRGGRARRKIEGQGVLKAKVDRWTGQYGQRSEDPDDQPSERTGTR